MINQCEIQELWNTYKAICDIQKLSEKVNELPDSVAKDNLLTMIQLKVPQAFQASDTTLLITENRDLRNQILHLERCVNDYQLEIANIQQKLKEARELDKTLNVILNQLPRWKLWLVGFNIHD